MRPRLDHLEEQAELYALGLLVSDEYERVDAHVRTCRDCAERVGRAEMAVAAMVDATQTPQAAPRAVLQRVRQAARALEGRPDSVRPWRALSAWASAAAVVFAVSTGALVAQNAALRWSVASDGTVFGAMVHSHFNHAQFLSPDGTPIDAKVVYERHGGWYQILATGIDANSRVAVVRAGAIRVAPERLVQRGTALALTLHEKLGAIDELRLLDAQGQLIARVRPVLSPDSR